MTSSVPNAVTRPAPTMGPHPLFRETAAKSYLFNAPNGTAVTITPFTPTCAGVYGVLMETGSNVSFGFFRLDDSGTVTIIQDSADLLRNSAAVAKVGIFVVGGRFLRLHNQLNAAADCNLTIWRIATA